MLNEWSDRECASHRGPGPAYQTSWIWVVVSFVGLAGFIYLSLA